MKMFMASKGDRITKQKIIGTEGYQHQIMAVLHVNFYVRGQCVSESELFEAGNFWNWKLFEPGQVRLFLFMYPIMKLFLAFEDDTISRQTALSRRRTIKIK